MFIFPPGFEPQEVTKEMILLSLGIAGFVIILMLLFLHFGG